MDDFGGGAEGFQFVEGEGEVDDFLDAVSANNTGQREGHVLNSVLSGQRAGKRHDLLFVALDGLDYAGDDGGDAVIGGTLFCDHGVSVFPGLI